MATKKQQPTSTANYETISQWDADGWVKPSEGLIVEGHIREVRAMKDRRKQIRIVYTIQLLAPCVAKPIGEDELEEFEAGQCLLLGETYTLRCLRQGCKTHVNNQVKLECTGKKELESGQSIWLWKVGQILGTPRRIPLALKPISDEFDDVQDEPDAPASIDDIPF